MQEPSLLCTQASPDLYPTLLRPRAASPLNALTIAITNSSKDLESNRRKADLLGRRPRFGAPMLPHLVGLLHHQCACRLLPGTTNDHGEDGASASQPRRWELTGVGDWVCEVRWRSSSSRRRPCIEGQNWSVVGGHRESAHESVVHLF